MITREPVYSPSEALAGIMVFEYVEMHNQQAKFKRYYQKDGVCEVRHMCLVLGSYIDRLYDKLSISDIYCEPFDMELVPRILEDLEDPFKADLVKIQGSMLKVVQEADAAEELQKLGVIEPKPAWKIEAEAGNRRVAIKLYGALNKVTMRVAGLAVAEYLQGQANG